MQLSRQQRHLVLSGIVLSVIMAVLIPLGTRDFDPLTGLVGVFVGYWVFYCIPVALYFGRGLRPVAVGFDRSPVWVGFLALALPVAVFFGSGALNWLAAEPSLLMIAVGCAVINGPLEELAWRRPFRAYSHGRLSFEVIGLMLFTLWHVPFYFVHGVSFDHDAAGLIGGAFALGLVWMLMTRTTNSVGWPIVSHALVNAAGFIGLFASNFGGS